MDHVYIFIFGVNKYYYVEILFTLNTSNSYSGLKIIILN